MSTILQQTQDNENENVSYELVDVEENQSEQDKELVSVLGELGVEGIDDILLKVYRINDMGKDAHIFDCLPEAINGMEDRLRNGYGRGDYKIKVFTPTSSGGKAVKKTVRISIETPIEKETEKENDPHENIGDVVASMMLAMEKQSTAMMMMFQKSQLESQNKQQELIIQVLSNKNNDEKKPNFIEQLAALKAIMPEQKDPMEGVLAMLKVTDKIKESTTPESAPSEGSMGQLLQLGSQLVDAAKHAPQQSAQQPAQQSAQQPAQQSAQQPAQQPAQQSAQLEDNTENQDMNFIIKAQLKNHLNGLCIKAGEGKNPLLWAELTLDEIPEQYYPQLVEVLGDSDEAGFMGLCDINPCVLDHKVWFDEFIAFIRDAFESDEEPVNGEEGTDNSQNNLTNVNDSGDDTANKADFPHINVNKNDQEKTIKNDT